MFSFKFYLQMEVSLIKKFYVVVVGINVYCEGVLLGCINDVLVIYDYFFEFCGEGINEG